MAGGAKIEFPPLLPAGFHRIGIDGVNRLCVERFPDSITRRRIMANLRALIEMAQTQEIRGEFWIDGSFLTEKLNPDDADLVLAVSEREFRAMTPPAKKFFTWYSNTNLYTDYKCDNYPLIRGTDAESEYLYAYWLRQFGFSRADQMKGLAVVTVPYLVSP